MANRRAALVPLLATVLSACPGTTTTPPSSKPTPGRASDKPRLVVLVVLDQWPEWSFEQKRPALTGGGFDRLLSEGQWHVGQHPSMATLTAPGHALLGTGEPTATSGILSNEWFHRDLGRALLATEDVDGSVSARWLKVPGLGDSIAAANLGGKAVGISLKDRAAVLPLGHTGTPIWYDRKQVTWTSNAKPAWLAAYNAAHPIAAHLKHVWTPLDPARLATLSGTIDAQPGEVGEHGFGPTFPHAIAETKMPAEAIFASAVGNELLFDVATAAIDGEHLGQDAAADLLVISLSPHDYVGHGWGHESWEMWDLTMRIDALLGTFLQTLDTKVGVGQWSMIVTSDHGASPLPERTPKGGRLIYDQLKDAANRAAIAELGPGEWIAFAKYPTLYVTDALLAKPPKDRDQALKKIGFALRAFPGIARVERTADFAGNCDQRTGDALVVCLGLDPERSGEILWLPAEGWISEDLDEPMATAHGSSHAYDRLVPVLMLPPGRTAHAPLATHDDTVIQMVRIAPVLAGWLGVQPPSKLPRTP